MQDIPGEIRADYFQQRYRPPGNTAVDVTSDEQAEAVLETGSGGLRRIGGARQKACSCNCLNAPPGGFCHECLREGVSEGLTCERCFHRCSGAGCGIGLCLSHSFAIEEEGEIRRLCVRCFEPVRRARRTRQILRLIFFPLHVLIWIFFKPVEQDDVRILQKQVETLAGALRQAISNYNNLGFQYTEADEVLSDLQKFKDENE